VLAAYRALEGEIAAAANGPALARLQAMMAPHPRTPKAAAEGDVSLSDRSEDPAPKSAGRPRSSGR
jgi:hypothetical protein